MADSALTFETPRRPQRLLLTWLLAVLWMAMIGFGSSERFSAHHTYVWLRAIWEYCNWPIQHLPDVNNTLRKLGHVTVYGIQSVLLFFAWRETLAWRAASRASDPAMLQTSARSRRRFALAVSLALLGTALIASLDELHQYFVPGRTGTLRDVILDTSAAAIAQLIIYRTIWSRRKTAPER